jgi:hypothetical protein
MNRDREIQIIADEIGRLAPELMRTRWDGSLYLERDECRTMAVVIFNRLQMDRFGKGDDGNRACNRQDQVGLAASRGLPPYEGSTEHRLD